MLLQGWELPRLGGFEVRGVLVIAQIHVELDHVFVERLVADDVLEFAGVADVVKVNIGWRGDRQSAFSPFYDAFKL